MAAKQLIVISHAEADPSYGIQQSKRGVATGDRLVVHIGLSDYTTYDENDRVPQYGSDSFINTNDTLNFRGNEYTITGMSEIFLNGAKPIKVEIAGK